MTFAPIPIIQSALNALAAHGIELPAVPTRIVAPYENQVYIDLDLSNDENLRAELRNLIPAQFFQRNSAKGSWHEADLRLLKTLVTFRFYEADQDDFYA